MKGKATNEQLAKVLEYTLSEHISELEKAKKENSNFLNSLQKEREILGKINLKPNLSEFDRINSALKITCENGANKIQSELRSFYLSRLVLGIVLAVFICSVGMMIYAFNKIEKANEIANAKELTLNEYFSKFLTDNQKANESFKDWKQKQ